MISVQNLRYSYIPGKSIVFPDFLVPSHGQCLLLGESGSGKTTLLHLLGGLLKSKEGSIIINDTNIVNFSESGLDAFSGKNMGFVFQKNHLISALSVKHNILMAPYLGGLKQDEKRVDEVLRQLDLSEKANSKISELSQGQAQRVSIARAVINKPSVILADEPTSALDDKNCERVIDLLVNVARENSACLFIATHDQRLKSKISQHVIL